MIKGFATAFPDFKHTVIRCVENGDMISCEGTFAGTHNGTMTMPDGKSIAATKKKVAFNFLGIARVKDNKVAELRVYFDSASLMAQLGFTFEPPASDAETLAAIEKMAAFEKRMCDCKVTDKPCADKVNEDMTKWATEMAKSSSFSSRNSRPSPALAKKAADIMTHYTECMTKIMMSSPPSKP